MALQSTPLLSASIVIAVRALARTWKMNVVDEAGLLDGSRPESRPLIWVFWHNRLLVVPVVYQRLFSHRKSAVLISRSRDGGILAGVIERFGGVPVRGSSSRGGASALRELERKMGEGYDAYITPDGPKGPRYSIAAGTIWLSRATGADLLPVSVECSSSWRLGRWDGFIIPRPFSRVTVTLRAPHRISPAEGGATAEEERTRLREVMLSQTGLR